LLATLDIETAPTPDAAIIWLHGLGADAHDFESIVPELVTRGERAWRFVFPNAPVRPVSLNGGMPMRAWYDIVQPTGRHLALDPNAEEDLAGFWDSEARIRELLARETQRGIPPGRIVLGGFSQGGAVSLFTAPRLAARLAGVLALSCYLPLAGRLGTERLAANQATPIFMAHGQADPLLPLSLGSSSRDFLREQGYTVEWHQYPMAHSVCAAEVADIRAFLFRVLPPLVS
jgi:phospholipase/carboxylesterase